VSAPLIALICCVPLIGEGIRPELEFADVHSFKGERDTAGLLRSLEPDLVIVDSSADAREASAYALERDSAVLHISVRSRTLRLFQRGAWKQVGATGAATPEAVRNVVAGTLFARGASA
jgi:hypothetical protein